MVLLLVSDRFQSGLAHDFESKRMNIITLPIIGYKNYSAIIF